MLINVVAQRVDENNPLLAPYHTNVATSYEAVKQEQLTLHHYQIAIDLALGSHLLIISVLLIRTRVWEIFDIMFLANTTKQLIVMSVL